MNKEDRLDLDFLIEDPIYPSRDSLEEIRKLHHRIERKILRRLKKYIDNDIDEHHLLYIFCLGIKDFESYEECKDIIKNNWNIRKEQRALKNIINTVGNKKRNRL